MGFKKLQTAHETSLQTANFSFKIKSPDGLINFPADFHKIF